MSSPKRPKVQVPEEPAPSPQPVPGREEEEAKKKVRQRAKRGGREANVLANKMMSGRNDTFILSTKLSGQ